MNKQIFVTGIGTEVGKTVCSAILTEALQADYWKPVQAGDLHDTDTHKVKRWVSNPNSKFFPERYALEHPMSPHAAADKQGIRLSVSDFQIPSSQNNLVIEGAGGLMVPINPTEVVLDIIPTHYPIVLVSRNYLGSINHTLLSVAYLQSCGYKKIAILFNGEETPSTEAIIAAKTNLPILGRIPHLKEITPKRIRQQAENIQVNLAAFLVVD